MQRANRSFGVQGTLYTALIAGTGNPILAQDQSNGNTSTAVLRSKIEALLGGFEDSVSPDDHGSLPLAGVTSVVSNKQLDK